MKRKFLVLTANGPKVDWLGEYDTEEEAQAHLDEHTASNKECEAGWVIPTRGRNYTNT